MSGVIMPNETREQLILDKFPGFDPRVPAGATTGTRMPGQNRLKFSSGVEVAVDGSYRWSRDQFRIGGPSGQTITSLYEIAFESYNQLLAFCDDENMYVMDTDWASETPSQWDYGYDLFGGTGNTWTAVALAQNGIYSAADMVNHLFIPISAYGTSTGEPGSIQRWDGATLTPVGLAAPSTAPYRTGTTETFETDYYTEVDVDDILTLDTSANTITIDSAGNKLAYLYKDEASADAIGDYDIYFNFSVSEWADPNRLALVSATQSLGDVPDRGQQDVVCFVKLAHRADFWLYTFNTATEYRRVELRDLELDTTYYCHFYKSGTTVRLDVYYDSAMTLLKNSGMVQSYAADRKYRYFVLMNTWDDYDAAMVGILGGVDLVQSSTLYETSGKLLAGTYGYFYTNANDDFESMPSPVSQQITVVVDGGKISLAGIALPTDDSVTKRKLYRAYSPEIGSALAWEHPSYISGRRVVTEDEEIPEGAAITDRSTVDLGAYQYVADIAVDTSDTTTYEDNIPWSSLGDVMTYDYALPPYGKEIVYHRDRLWMARITQTSTSYTTTYTTDQQNKVYYTPISAPAYWPGDYQITVGDAAPIVGLHSWRNYLFIFKTNGTWVLSGYDDQDWSLEKLDDNGMCAYHAVASNQQGVMWWSNKGLMWFNGSSVTTKVPAVDSALTAPELADSEKDCWLAYHHGRFYVVSDGNLFWWDTEMDIWGAETAGDITAGIRSFNLGDKQSHLLCLRTWVAAGDAEITALHTGRAYSTYATEGSSDTDYFAPIDIILTPLVCQPDEEIELLEVWIDGGWTDGATGHMELQVSNDASTWTTIGDLADKDQSSGNRGNLLRENAIGNPVYIRLVGTSAEDFRLYMVKIVYVRRAIRATVAT